MMIRILVDTESLLMKWRKPLLLLFIFLIVLFSGWAAWLPSPRVDGLKYSFQLLDHQGIELRRLLTQDGYWRLPAEVDNIDPAFIKMLLAYEDKRFYEHNGIDLLALMRAIGQWLRHGYVISGASTLSMQTVRLLYPRPRTISSKLTEMLQAMKLEWRYDKKSILAFYLELAPYGGNLQGVRAASLSYFGKEPDRLTDSEAALLIALPQSPETRRPDRHPEKALAARNFVLRQLHDKGLLTQADMLLASQQSIPTKRTQTPFSAPHLADRMRRQYPDARQIKTTIDSTLQQRLQLLAQRQHWLSMDESIAMLIVSNADRTVRAHLGSADYLHQSWLDLTRAVRSPGSTLKPFIYGLGFETQLMHPETRVKDRVYRAGVYAPQNFDATYTGDVSLRVALQQSLNVPAVKAMEKLQPSRLLQRFHKVGVDLRLPKGQQAGLSIALGGAGITLEELVAMYAAVAQGGEYWPLRYLDEKSPIQPVPLLSPAAAWYLDDILKDTQAPDGFARNRPLRFKTGTSYGYRDAWAIGYDSNHTIGVWVGHPDGSAEQQRSGRSSAAPLLFQAFELLPKIKDYRTQSKPPDVLTLAYHELPKHLQWLTPEGTTHRAEASDPRIVYPVANSTILLQSGEAEKQPVILKAEAGRGPFHWLINGGLLRAEGPQRQAQWIPDGPGQVDITLIDGAGRRDRVALWILESL